mmetsp:Transcript_9308/g.28969  ORF Transcript_9308/g.28969 Transcript_9308/m.28969 type:complete len:203 (+) Transcript_9308:523-1131(+)
MASTSGYPESLSTAVIRSADCWFVVVTMSFTALPTACWSMRTSCSSAATLLEDSSRACWSSFWRLRNPSWTCTAAASWSFWAAVRMVLMSAWMPFSCLSKSCGRQLRMASKSFLFSWLLASKELRRCSMDVTLLPCWLRVSPTAASCLWTGLKSVAGMLPMAPRSSRCFSCNPALLSCNLSSEMAMLLFPPIISPCLLLISA